MRLMEDSGRFLGGKTRNFRLAENLAYKPMIPESSRFDQMRVSLARWHN